MRWQGREESGNVEDRRGLRVPGGRAGIGCGGLLLVLGISYLTGVDPRQILGLVQQVAPRLSIRPHLTFMRVLDSTAWRLLEPWTPTVTFGLAVTFGS